MRKLDFKYAWESFWPLPSPLQADQAPELDAGWLAARGIDPGAPLVLGCLRDEVLPLVRRLEGDGTLAWYAFLIHGYASGVPTPPDDPRSFVHLRLVVKKRAPLRLPERWLFTRRAPLLKEIAGISASALVTKDIDAAWWLIGAQSAWVLSFIEQHKDADMLDLIRHAKQFLHFFVNMTQVTAH